MKNNFLASLFILLGIGVVVAIGSGLGFLITRLLR